MTTQGHITKAMIDNLDLRNIEMDVSDSFLQKLTWSVDVIPGDAHQFMVALAKESTVLYNDRYNCNAVYDDGIKSGAYCLSELRYEDQVAALVDEGGEILSITRRNFLNSSQQDDGVFV